MNKYVFKYFNFYTKSKTVLHLSYVKMFSAKVKTTWRIGQK